MDATQKTVRYLFDSIFDVIIGNLYEDTAKFFDDIYPGVSEILIQGDNDKVLNLTCMKTEVFDIISQSLDKSKKMIVWTLKDCDIDDEDSEMIYVKEWVEDFENHLTIIYDELTNKKEQISLYDISIYILTIESIKDDIIENEIKKLK